MTDKELREIRRRFRPDKNNILGIRGCIVGENREITAEFYQQMSLCSVEESEKLLSVMKKSLSGGLGTNLIDIVFRAEQVVSSEEHGLLMALLKSELRDDNAVKTFFERVKENVHLDGSYAILLALDTYDVFSYTSDGEKNESTDVFSYIVCSVCPIKALTPALTFRDYDSSFHSVDLNSVLSNPEIGFLFPTFDDRATNIYNALYYTRNIADIQSDFVSGIFNVELPMAAAEQKETFDHCLAETLGSECDFETVRSVHEQISEMVQLHKESKDPEPLTLSCNALKTVLEGCGVDEEKISGFEERFDEGFGKNAEVTPKNIVNVKQFEVKTPDVTIKVNPERRDLVSTQVIGGVKYIMIRAAEGVSVNGVNININE